MKRHTKLFSKLGIALLTSSLLLAACTNSQSKLDLDYDAVQDSELAKKQPMARTFKCMIQTGLSLKIILK